MSKLRKKMADFEKWAKDEGWKWKMTNGGHIMWTHPNANNPVFTCKTPSDFRAMKNNMSYMRKALAAQ